MSFKIYAESIPGPGYVGGNTGLYLIRHEPFSMLSDLADNYTVADEHIVPFSQFATDVADGNLPAFSFVVPNIDDDAHNGTPRQADSWLQTNVVSPLSNDSAFQPGGNGVLIVDFDESVDSDIAHGGGHVAAVFWGPAAKTGYKQSSSTVYQHQSMLRTVMQFLGLSNPPGASASAPPMSEFFAQY
jgi:acid phosphatase